MSKHAPLANNYQQQVAVDLFAVVAQLCKEGSETPCAHRWWINCKSEDDKKRSAYRPLSYVVQLVSATLDPYP